MNLKSGRIPNPVREWDRTDPGYDQPGPVQRLVVNVALVVSAVVVVIAGLMFLALTIVVLG